MDDVGGFAPLSAEWKSVLQDSKPGCCVADVADVGNRKKVAMKALCISLAQDQRGRRFPVRFRNPDLEVCEGTLQLIKASSSPDNPGAQGIREMTLKALQSFCTPSAPPNYPGLRKDVKEVVRECDFSMLEAMT